MLLHAECTDWARRPYFRVRGATGLRFKNGVPWRPMGLLLKGKGTPLVGWRWDSFCRQSGLLLPCNVTPFRCARSVALRHPDSGATVGPAQLPSLAPRACPARSRHRHPLRRSHRRAFSAVILAILHAKQTGQHSTLASWALRARRAPRMRYAGQLRSDPLNQVFQRQPQHHRHRHRPYSRTGVQAYRHKGLG